AAWGWRLEDQDADVRKTAYRVSLYTRPKLAEELRGRDPELKRQLAELEARAPGPSPEAQPAAAAKSAEDEGNHGRVAAQIQAIALKPQKSEPPATLAEADYNPLLQATASRSLDTCLLGARGLAVLGDPRAFGLLLQLSREQAAWARVEVCRALAALDDPRSLKRLRTLLHDAEASVRDAAFTALAHIHADEPLLATESGLN